MRTLLLALFFISSLSIAADTTSSVDGVLAEPILSLNDIDEIKSFELEKLKAEVSYLKAQNTTLDKYLERLNNSYYAAISFAGGFLLLFLGFNFFSFKGQIKDEKDVLLTHINSQIKELENKLENSFFNHSNNANLEYQALQNSLPAIVSSQISSELSVFESKMLLKQKEGASSTLKSISSITGTTEAIRKDVSRVANDVKTFEFDIRYDYYELQIDFQKVSDAPKSTRLRTYLKFIKLLQDTNRYVWKISDCLNQVLTLLNNGANFNPNDLPEVEIVLKSLQDSHQVTVNKIINLL
ncbi:hypothetical protein [Shewanella sp. NKUCC06_TVS]|uniref:hypothetical protein n=1 Tax=Shewanella sp. NKUCC06_TVS TaxID=2842128 RepID=UPI001C5AF2FD|nr:hypothetical protein [Shewanella sp. NKUCC06_TVS]MBW3530673.1 hypothetical protein [Shewanella sp. NKUCC06_TVS]